MVEYIVDEKKVGQVLRCDGYSVSLNLQQISTSEIMEVFPMFSLNKNMGGTNLQVQPQGIPGFSMELLGLPGRAEEAHSEGGTADGLQSELCPTQCRRRIESGGFMGFWVPQNPSKIQE